MFRFAARHALLAVAAVALGAGAAPTAVGAAPISPPSEAGSTETIPARWLELTNEQDWEQENPYVDCDSLAVRRPGCGSKDRGGWHQTLVLVAVLAGLVVVGTRVVYAARERPTGASQSGRDTPTGSEDQQ